MVSGKAVFLLSERFVIKRVARRARLNRKFALPGGNVVSNSSDETHFGISYTQFG